MRHDLYLQTRFDAEENREVTRLVLMATEPCDVTANTMTGQQIGFASVGLGVKKVGYVYMPDQWRTTIGEDGRMVVDDKWSYDVADLISELGGVKTGGGSKPVVIRVPHVRR